jgi:hypothetical protein
MGPAIMLREVATFPLHQLRSRALCRPAPSKAILPLFSSQPLPSSPAVGTLVEMESGKDHGGKGAPAHSQAIK